MKEKPDLEQEDARLAMLDEFQGLLLQRQSSVESNNAKLPQLLKNPKEEQDERKLDLDIRDWLEQAYSGENLEQASACPENDVSNTDSLFKFCKKKLNCEHSCCGVHGAQKCLPCIEPGCSEYGAAAKKDEVCSICFTTELGSDPCIMLLCGHIFHAACVGNLLKHKWSTLKISFAFMSCPSCKTPFKEIDCL